MTHAPEAHAPSTTSRGGTARRARATGAWLAGAAFAVVLIALLLFIAQNSKTVQVRYLSADTSIGFGVALVLSAVAGAVLAALGVLVLRVRRSVRGRS